MTNMENFPGESYINKEDGKTYEKHKRTLGKFAVASAMFGALSSAVFTAAYSDEYFTEKFFSEGVKIIHMQPKVHDQLNYDNGPRPTGLNTDIDATYYLSGMGRRQLSCDYANNDKFSDSPRCILYNTRGLNVEEEAEAIIADLGARENPGQIFNIGLIGVSTGAMEASLDGRRVMELAPNVRVVMLVVDCGQTTTEEIRQPLYRFAVENGGFIHGGRIIFYINEYLRRLKDGQNLDDPYVRQGINDVSRQIHMPLLRTLASLTRSFANEYQDLGTFYGNQGTLVFDTHPLNPEDDELVDTVKATEHWKQIFDNAEFREIPIAGITHASMPKFTKQYNDALGKIYKEVENKLS